MPIKRRFQSWKFEKTGKAVNVNEVIKENGTGDLYILKNFCAAREGKELRVKVLAWDKRITGTIEIKLAADFGIVWG